PHGGVGHPRLDRGRPRCAHALPGSDGQRRGDAPGDAPAARLGGAQRAATPGGPRRDHGGDRRAPGRRAAGHRWPRRRGALRDGGRAQGRARHHRHHRRRGWGGDGHRTFTRTAIETVFAGMDALRLLVRSAEDPVEGRGAAYDRALALLVALPTLEAEATGEPAPEVARELATRVTGLGESTVVAHRAEAA